VDESSDDLEMAQTEDDEVAAIVYTSGTTGDPKGVMHTHYGLYYNALMQHETVQFPPDLVNMAVLPLCHFFGIATMNYRFLSALGKTVVLRAFKPDQLFSAIETYKVNSLAAVPTMYVYMLLYPDAGKYDLSSMKYYTCGSAPLSAQTWHQFKAKFGLEISEGWGLTEAGANNCVNPTQGMKKVGSIGKPMKGIEMKIFNDDGAAMPKTLVGKILKKELRKTSPSTACSPRAQI
jgi:long-chain acyl-CoA synthetase